jgi:3-oxoacyl-[acyl-carrier protein] reductase
LTRKVAIVSGASRGIGQAIARRLARDGAACILCARNQEALDTVAGGIRRDGGQAEVFAADLRDASAPAALVDFAIAKCGRLDVVVNNAGATARGEFLSLTDEQWTDGYALKLFGAARLCRAAWPHLEASQGSIVNIAGIGGRTPGADFSIGGSVNAALMAVTKSLADLGVARHVQVNAINPGSVRTDRLTRRLATLSKDTGLTGAEVERRFVQQAGATRIGEPDDVAALVAFLVGPEGRFLHGALIDLDGGSTKSL